MHGKKDPSDSRIKASVSFMDSYAPINAQGSEEIVIAEAIFEAATDGEDRLRYPAGQAAITKIGRRKEEAEAQNLADMRAQFEITSRIPGLDRVSVTQ